MDRSEAIDQTLEEMMTVEVVADESLEQRDPLADDEGEILQAWRII